MGKNCVFIINDHEFNVIFNLNFFKKLGEDICKELYNSEKYYVRSKVSNSIFEQFLDFLNDKIKYPEIDINNYYDYFLLSNEFNHILSEYLSKADFDSIRYASFIQKAISNEIKDKSYIEEYISYHLDFYLEHYKEEMRQIPFSTLYNIFQNKKRILNNQERAYQFIKQIIEEGAKYGNGNIKSLCVLFETLDSSKLSEESIKESFQKREEYFGFAPKINLSFINSFNENISELKLQYENSFTELIKQQQEMMCKMKTFFEENVKIMQLNYIELLKRSENTKNDIKAISQSIQNIENKSEQISKKTDDTMKKSSDKNEEIIKIVSDINELKKKNESISLKSDQLMNIFLADHGHFNGIIHQLSQQCGGNAADKKIVEIKSSTHHKQCPPRNALDYDDLNYFVSENEKDQWLQIDFKDKKEKPMYYSIQSRYYGKGVKNLMNWVIEGSNTENNWTLLDKRENVTSLDESNAVNIFFIQKKSEFYKYLRLRQTGLNSEKNNYLSLASIEYYGSIQ